MFSEVQADALCPAANLAEQLSAFAAALRWARNSILGLGQRGARVSGVVLSRSLLAFTGLLHLAEKDTHGGDSS